MVNLRTYQHADIPAHWHKRSTRRPEKSHTQTCVFPHFVRQTYATVVVRKGSQMVISKFNYKHVTELEGKMISLSAG